MVEVGPVTILDLWRSDAIEHIILDPQYLRVFSCFFHSFFFSAAVGQESRWLRRRNNFPWQYHCPLAFWLVLIYCIQNANKKSWIWSKATNPEIYKVACQLCCDCPEIWWSVLQVCCATQNFSRLRTALQNIEELCFTLLTAFSEARWLVSPSLAGPENDRLGLNVLSH